MDSNSSTDAGFSKALVTLKFFQGKYSEVFRLLEEGKFPDKSGLLEIWDQAHYKEYEHKLGRQLTALLRFRIRKRFPPPPHICPNGERPTARLGEAASRLLKSWFIEHQQHPYPSKREKESLATVSGLSLSQVKTWFANTRRRTRLKNTVTPSQTGNPKRLETDGEMQESGKQPLLHPVLLQPEYTDVSDDDGAQAVGPPNMLVPKLEPVPLDMRRPQLSPEFGRMMSLEVSNNTMKGWHKPQQHLQSFTGPEPLHYSQCISSIATYVNHTAGAIPNAANCPDVANLGLPFSISHGAVEQSTSPAFIWSNHMDPKYWPTMSPAPHCSSSYRWPRMSLPERPPVISSPARDGGLSRLPSLSPQIFGWSQYTRPDIDPASRGYCLNSRPAVTQRPPPLSCTTDGNPAPYDTKHQPWLPSFILPPSSATAAVSCGLTSSCGTVSTHAFRQSCMNESPVEMMTQASSDSLSHVVSPSSSCPIMGRDLTASQSLRLGYQELVNRNRRLAMEERVIPSSAVSGYKVDNIIHWSPPVITDQSKNSPLPPAAHCWLQPPECTVQKVVYNDLITRKKYHMSNPNNTLKACRKLHRFCLTFQVTRLRSLYP
ncbi:uncharacterized protein LOC121387672 isoform X2 [Gigantopelta aegis]|uniref:uncharacterized protein LOC121387672 isoform X2 n=1 Tax=Gigantopelta aegis TaxID=1735272 RepID=UPI001B88A838|nr:uncharacterized protein LOC121387672 isoform X2 [Gigantopelta aegis]